MKTPIKVENYTAADAPQIAEWTEALSHRNNVDREVYGYPTLNVLKASNGRPICYMPYQITYTMESLAFNPDATAQEKAAALRDEFTVLEYEARTKGIREINFLCSDREMKLFCVHHFFDVMTPKVILSSTYAENGYPDVSNSDMQLFRRKV